MVLNSLLGDSLRKDNRLVASYIRTQKSVSGFDMVAKAKGIFKFLRNTHDFFLNISHHKYTV